ncbi:HIT domain-containing protein [Buchnera aphidicola]|uniref:HIT domain-containing protein n=1 Tax=Buchnera aphidicola TaxID=9 RepID=UPI0022390B39|nr:HIT domain-containing protein [Buchnera aphidicola]MCW5197782.1 HIT domain-containing protein [Buchnera aphidicola (Chaitophorus viminalis)]
MNNKEIFKNIIKRKIKAKIVFQNKKITAFHDISPKSKLHILIVPNIFIKNLNYINKKNLNILSYMLYKSIKIAKQERIHKSGYRIIINCNKNGGQKIPYLHLHLLGGEKLKNF